MRFLILLIAAIVAACVPGTGGPSEPLVPANAGVVAGLEQLPDKGRTFVYRLESGETVQIALDEADIIGAAGGPGVGNLLLAGRKASGQAWISGLPRDPVVESHPECFRLEATGIGHGAWIDMSNGLRLAKAEDFHQGSIPVGNERYAIERFAFCLNSRGEVTSYDVY